MTDDMIIKGNGVYKRHGAGRGYEFVPQSFPSREADSAHGKKMSHFHIDHETGSPHAEIPDNMRYWPMEAAAMYLSQNPKLRNKVSVRDIKKYFNTAAMKFNEIKRKHGDDFHTVPIPFDEDGNLHPEYKTNHYGIHENRSVPTRTRKTRDKDGKLINLHYNSVAHPTIGHFLESASFHFEKEFRKLMQDLGIETDLGARQNVIEPQQIVRAPVRMGDGRIEMRSLLHRYHSGQKSPENKGSHVSPEYGQEDYNAQAQYGQIRPIDIVAFLAQNAPAFFNTDRQAGRFPNKVVNALMDAGISQRRAKQMAIAPAAQLILGRGKKGAATKLNNLVNRIQDYIGIAGPRKDPTIADVYHKHRSHFDGRVGGADRGRSDASKRILATFKTAQELGVDLTPITGSVAASPGVVNGWLSYANRLNAKPINFEAMGLAEEHHQLHNKVSQDKGHLYLDGMPNHISAGEMPTSIDGPMDPSMAAVAQTTQQPFDTDPFAPAGTVATRNNADDFTTSADDPMGAIAVIMERVQMRDTWEDARIMKRVKHVNLNPQNNNDMNVLAKQVGLETNDVRAIAMTFGNWDRLAQHFQVGLDVVEIIKASCVEVVV
jgi:hypothetical protein